MPIPTPPPTIEIFNITIYFAVIFNIIAFAVLYFTSLKKLKKKKEKKRLNILFVLILIFGLYLGPRITHNFSSFGKSLTFSEKIIATLNPFSFGMVFYGGLIFAILTIIIYLKYKKENISKWSDFFIPQLFLALAIGRIGCFFNGCCFGKLTNLPWAVFQHNNYLHPTQLYLSINAFLLFFLFSFLKKKRIIRTQGNLFLYALITYSSTRFLIEFFRTYQNYYLGLSLSQIISLLLIIIITFILYKNNKEKNFLI
jgi:phosphatidylglycerol---prolipoprotein diacylglyceryl transferase